MKEGQIEVTVVEIEERAGKVLEKMEKKKVRLTIDNGLIDWGKCNTVKIEAIESRFPGGGIVFRALFHTRKVYIKPSDQVVYSA